MTNMEALGGLHRRLGLRIHDARSQVGVDIEVAIDWLTLLYY